MKEVQNCRDKNHTGEGRQFTENFPLIAENQHTSVYHEEGTISSFLIRKA